MTSGHQSGAPPREAVEPLEEKATRNPAAAVHGTVLTGALIAVQSAHGDIDVSRLVVLVLVTQVVYWLAHVYAELVGQRIARDKRVQPVGVRHLLTEEWPLVAVSFVPLLVIGVTSLLGMGANAAVLSGLWTNVALLAAWALLAGLRSRLRVWELLAYLGVSLLLGSALIAIKALLH